MPLAMRSRMRRWIAAGLVPATLDGRTGNNAELPYSLTAFTAVDGAEVVNRNCLTCHGGRFDGEIVIGLGTATADFTTTLGGNMTALPSAALFESLGLDAAETANLEKMLRTARAVGPYTAMRTIGMNPAEQLTGALIAHHDQKTLAWSEKPLLPIEVRGANGEVILDAQLTSDPPPWWRAKKKHALFYNGMARGDHRGTMALAAAACSRATAPAATAATQRTPTTRSRATCRRRSTACGRPRPSSTTVRSRPWSYC